MNIFLAWLVGEGIIAYRSYKKGHPPMPGQMLASSGLFMALGLVAQKPDLKFLAGAIAWGFDIAAFMNVAPQMLTGATAAEKAATATTAATSSASKGAGAGGHKK